MIIQGIAGTGFVAVALAASVACSLPVSSSATAPTGHGSSHTTDGSFEEQAHPQSSRTVGEASTISAYTLNIDITDSGFVPSRVSVPVGRPVQLVVRNRGSSEHHYHVAGIHPTDMLWLSKAHLLAPVADRNEEHTGHHPEGFLPYHVCTSRQGLCPTGRDVHAHADPQDVDVLIFTATERGTFDAFCPLHPEIRGAVIVL